MQQKDKACSAIASRTNVTNVKKYWDLLWHHKGPISRSGSLRTLSGKVNVTFSHVCWVHQPSQSAFGPFLKNKTKHTHTQTKPAVHFYLTAKKRKKVRQTCQCHVWLDQRVVLAANKRQTSAMLGPTLERNSVCACEPVCAEAFFWRPANHDEKPLQN